MEKPACFLASGGSYLMPAEVPAPLLLVQACHPACPSLPLCHVCPLHCVSHTCRLVRFLCLNNPVFLDLPSDPIQLVFNIARIGVGLSNICIPWSWGTAEERNSFFYSVSCMGLCSFPLRKFSVGEAAFHVISDTTWMFLGQTRWWVQLHLIFWRNRENLEYDFCKNKK